MRGVEGLGQPRQIGPHAIDPHGVGIDKEKRGVAKQGQRLDDAAAGAEHLVPLIRDDHAGPRAPRDVIDDLIGQIVHIDDSVARACVAELVEHMVEQRAAGDADQRLWHPVRQGPHAHAKTGGEDHGFSGFDGHSGNFSNRCCWQRKSYHGVIRGGYRSLMP